MVGFSTAYTLPGDNDAEVVQIPFLNENSIEKAFRAIAESCEEAILNSMVAAETVVGYQGNVRYGAEIFLDSLL